MRRTTAQFACMAALTVAVLLTGCGTATKADPSGRAMTGTVGAAGADSPEPCPVVDPGTPQSPPTLIDGTPANTPEGARLSQAVGGQGRGAFADVYSTQITDHPAGRVAVCVTDLARGRLLVAAAHEADPQADPARADLYLSPYTHRALSAAMDKVTALEPAFPIHTCSVGQGATGLEVTSSAEGAASPEFKKQLEKASGGIPVTVKEGAPVQPLVGKADVTPAPVTP
ncbi:hypothetical protein ACFWBF_22435 [Streptomyces sp. NPDC060028]|uniref:hypothetical protein n=1 Tax=Streptomyces sp. NPDC060028 TaxID=3347041 RepID=UPI0036B8E6F3